MHQSSHPYFLLLSIQGINFIPYLQSVRIHVITTYGVSANNCCIALIGIDRAMSVLFPIWHNRLNKWMYLFGCFILCSIPALYISFEYYQMGVGHPDWPVGGHI